MLINVSSMTIMAILTYTLSEKYGVKIFSISFSIGFIFYVVVMIFALKKHLHNFNSKNFILSLSKSIISAGIMIMILLFTKSLELIMPEKLSHLLRIFIAAISYFSIAILLKSSEISSVKYILDRIFKKKTYESS